VDGLVGSDERYNYAESVEYSKEGVVTYFYTTTLTARSYVRADANWNVTSLVRAVASASPVFGTVERYEYDPYGSVTYLSGSFGALDRSGFGQSYLHQGGRLDEVTGLYSFRFREYDPGQGRWKQADPAGYVDGGSLYGAYVGRPTASVDPLGLAHLPNDNVPVVNSPGDGFDLFLTGSGLDARFGPDALAYISDHIDLHKLLGLGFRSAPSCGSESKTFYDDGKEQLAIPTTDYMLNLTGRSVEFRYRARITVSVTPADRFGCCMVHVVVAASGTVEKDYHFSGKGFGWAGTRYQIFSEINTVRHMRLIKCPPCAEG